MMPGRSLMQIIDCKGFFYSPFIDYNPVSGSAVYDAICTTQHLQNNKEQM